MKGIILVCAALFAGVVGGVVGTRIIPPHEQVVPQTIRAHSFELVNDAGAAISFWGVDHSKEAVLAFAGRDVSGAPHSRESSAGLLNPENQLATFGALGEDSPFLILRGRNGKTRARLLLSADGKPTLLMEDETGPRLSLGIEQSDTPGPSDNNWTLTFLPERARIGMFTENKAGQTYVRGVLLVNKDKVRYP